MSDHKPHTPKRLQFKGSELLEGTDNVHQFSLRAQVSAQTAYKYLQTPENVHAVDLKVLYALLIRGLGLTEKQMLDLKIGDLFKIVEVDE